MKRARVWTEAKKDRIRRFFAYWLNEFGYLPMTVDIQFREKFGAVSLCDGNAAVGIRFHYPYRMLEIECFPDLAKYSNEKLTTAVLHEMVHVVLARLKGNRRTEDGKVWERLEEEAADILAMVMTNHLRELRKKP